MQTQRVERRFSVYSELQKGIIGDLHNLRTGLGIHFQKVPYSCIQTIKFQTFFKARIERPNCCNPALNGSAPSPELVIFARRYEKEFTEWEEHWRNDKQEKPLYEDASSPTENRRCGGCGESRPFFSRRCITCNVPALILGEICHRPEFWACLTPYLYVSNEIKINQGTSSVVFCMDLRVDMCTMAFLNRPNTPLIMGLVWPLVFSRCRRRERIPSLQNSSLMTLFRQEFNRSGLLPEPLETQYRELESTLTRFTDVNRKEHDIKNQLGY